MTWCQSIRFLIIGDILSKIKKLTLRQLFQLLLVCVDMLTIAPLSILSRKKKGTIWKKTSKKPIALLLLPKIKNMLIDTIKRNIRNKCNVWYSNDGIVFQKF